MAGGSVTDPIKGYHMELNTTHQSVAREGFSLIQEALGFAPKTAPRGGGQVLYLKQSDQISDFLACLGASVASMGIIEAKLEKELNNKVNRRCNCDDANTSKVVEAAQEQLAAIRAQVGVFTEQLTQTRQQIAALEGTQSEADKATSVITDQMNALRTDSAALEAERTTANAHIADLRVLQAAAEGDKSRKLADMDAIAAENIRLQEEIKRQQKRQEENAGEIARVRQSMKDAQGEYTRIEAEKTKTEGDIQEKNKSILNMERACALLENKKETALLEERNTVDKLWDTYGLTPGTAVEKKAEIESVAAATRRIAELKRKISSLGTPNLGAIEEFARVNERYMYLTTQRDDVLSAKKDLEGIIKEITQQMTEIFVTEFAKINELSEVFQSKLKGMTINDILNWGNITSASDDVLSIIGTATLEDFLGSLTYNKNTGDIYVDVIKLYMSIYNQDSLD